MRSGYQSRIIRNCAKPISRENPPTALGRVRLPAQARLPALAERLKHVKRLNRVLGGSRRENSAEHSWHAAMTALVLADWSDVPIDPLRAAALLIVHDLVEIFAGDTNPFAPRERRTQRRRESRAARDLFGRSSVPPRIRALHAEFVRCRTPEARFAKAVDKFMPMLLSVVDPLSVNRKVTFTRKRYMQEKAPIAEASKALWDLSLKVMDAMEKDGYFLAERPHG